MTVIRYPIAKKELEGLIEKEKSGWLDRARAATKVLEEAGAYEDHGAIWSEIKAVYMRLQRDKCVFCERRLPSEEFGKGEHDVEHFRPKSEVKGWRDDSLDGEALVLSPPAVGAKQRPGYYLLAFHPLNYATSCRTCNSGLKANHFPIAGPRRPNTKDPTKTKSEKPYLVYPIGGSDADPADLIEFYGTSPRPRPDVAKFDRQRALVTIAFFQLDNAAGREELFRGRAEAIDHLWLALGELARAKTTPARDRAEKRLARLTAAHAEHTSCVRSFRRLWDEDPRAAEEVHDAISAYLDSLGPQP